MELRKIQPNIVGVLEGGYLHDVHAAGEMGCFASGVLAFCDGLICTI